MVDRQDPLLDVVDRLGAAAELDEDGIVQGVLDDAEHGLGHRGAEEQVLALGRDRVDDALHVGPEAHVEHAVGLVEHQGVDVVQEDVALAQHVEQAARRGDQQVDALADALGLRVVGHPAEDGHDAAPAVGAERLADLLDLPAEFAGRGHDEGGGVGDAAVGYGRACHALENGQDESGRLAGTGLRTAHHVATVEDARDGLFLDRRGLHVAHRGHAGEQLAFEAESGEGRDIDLRSGAGGALDVLALRVALVDALAAAVAVASAVAAAVAATLAVAVAAAALPAVVAPVAALATLAAGLRGAGAGAGDDLGRRRLRRAGLPLRGARLRRAVRSRAASAAAAAAAAAALLPALGGLRSGLAGTGDGRVGGGGGHRFSLPRRLRTRRIAVIRGRA